MTTDHVENFVTRLRAFHDGLPPDQQSLLARILGPIEPDVVGYAQGQAAGGEDGDTGTIWRDQDNDEAWARLSANLGKDDEEEVGGYGKTLN